jgi:F-type H+-transporting ATPase subunit c
MKKLTIFLTIVIVFALLTAVSLPAFAADDAVPEAQAETGESSGGLSAKAIAAAALIAIACATGAISMAIAISKSTDSMARQPEMAGKINSAMMLGLVFIETAVIYALIVAILIIFVL